MSIIQAVVIQLFLILLFAGFGFGWKGLLIVLYVISSLFMILLVCNAFAYVCKRLLGKSSANTATREK